MRPQTGVDVCFFHSGAFMKPIPMYFSRRSLLALAAAALVSACGGGGDDEHAHTNTVIDTAGRLAIAESAATGVRVFDLDTKVVAATFAMDSAPSALYTSPNGRYAVAYQGTAGKVQFIDGGVWQEDHADHLHDYRQAAARVDWTMTGHGAFAL
jgi:ABC-type amino acid transport substrate-binding protein